MRPYDPPPLPTARDWCRVAADTRLVKDLLGHTATRMMDRYTLGHVPEALCLATVPLRGAP